MKHWCLVVALTAPLFWLASAQADDPVFSGPQVGEALPPFTMASVLGETAGQELDIVKQADGKPILLIFVQGRTRPGFGLTNTLMKYAGTRAKDGLHSAVVFLTDDPTTTEQWMGIVKQHFSPENVMYGISHEGVEGPGSYGLNRNMTLTILVGKEGKVTANYALVQPSEQADGPKILKDIVDVLGGGEVPTLADLGALRYQMPAKNMRQMENTNPKLAALVKKVTDKEATPEAVKAAAAEVEEYIAENEKSRAQLGAIAASVVRNDSKEFSGTEAAQKVIRAWAKKYGPGRERMKRSE